MNLHGNAAPSLKGRPLALSVVSGEPELTEAAEAAVSSLRCASKWVDRHRAGVRLVCCPSGGRS